MDTDAEAITESQGENLALQRGEDVKDYVQSLLKTNERIEHIWALHDADWLVITNQNVLTITLTDTHEINSISSYPVDTIQELTVTHCPKPNAPYQSTATILYLMSITTGLLGSLTSTSLYLLFFLGAALLAVAGTAFLIQSQRAPEQDLTRIKITLKENQQCTFTIPGNQTPELLKSRLR